MTTRIVSWFHADTERFHSTYSQTLGSSTTASHYRVYERCLRVLFSSARRWHPAAALVLVTNVPVEQVFGPDTVALLDRLRVQRSVVPNTHETPPGYWARWQNQFYVLDVLRAILRDDGVLPQDPVFVLDSDVVVTAPLHEVVLGGVGLAALPIVMGPDVEENGVTRRQLGDLIEAFPDSVSRPAGADLPEYLGGELVAGRASVLQQVLDRAEQGFTWSMARRSEGLSGVNEEAHLLSFAVQSLGLTWARARFIERMWTQPWKYRTVVRDDARRVLWHLPAEKKTGIVRLDRAAMRDGWFWTAPPAVWRRRVGGITGVPRYRPTKLLLDLAMLVANRLMTRAR